MRKITVLLFAAFSIAFVNAQSYKKLHFKSIVADTHNDVLSNTIMEGRSIETDQTGRSHTDLARLKKGGVDVQMFSVWCGENYGVGSAYARAMAQIDSLYAIIKRNPDKMQLVTNTEELMQAVKKKKLAAMIGVEGGHMIEDKIEYLDTLFMRGARYMTLTWNNSTSWATSAYDESRNSFTLTPLGLTEKGKQIVRHMNELGMMVDISHVGEKTFWDVMKIVNKPVIASHSCAWSLCPVFRNLKDDQIKAIGKNGGVIFLNFYSGFVDSTFNRRSNAFNKEHKAEMDSLLAIYKEDWLAEQKLYEKYKDEVYNLRPPLSMLMDHLDYIVKLIGVDHVGLGSDFDGINSSPQQLDDVTSYPIITKSLLERGYSKEDVKKILGENFIRVLKANTGK